MRLPMFVMAVMAAAPAALAMAQDKSPAIRKGDTVVVRGCLDGGVVLATDVARADEEDASSMPIGATFRLTGDKKIVKALKDKHDGKIVSVKGVLKSELRDGPQGYNVGGGVRIGIGTPTGAPGGPVGEAPRSLPQLDVKSFEGGETSCKR